MIYTRFLLPTILFVCVVAIQPAFAKTATVRPAKPAQLEAVKIYGKWCSDCHTSPTGPGSIALQRKYQGAVPAVLEKRTDLSADYVKLVVRKGISFMPSFRKTEISDNELAMISAYLAPSDGIGPATKGKRK